MCSSKESQFDHLVEVEKRRWGRDVRLVLCNQQGRNPPGEGTNLTTSGPPWLWLVNSGQYLTKLVIIGQESPNILGSANLTKSSLREKDITLPKRGCSFVWTRVIKSHIDHIDQLSQWLSDHYFSATFIVFLLKKAFPQKMILECTNIFKKVLKKAIKKAVKEKSSQKSAQKSTQKSCFAQEWAQKNHFSPKKRSKKFFFVKKVLIKANAQKSIPSRGG